MDLGVDVVVVRIPLEDFTSLAIETLSAGARVTEALRCGDGLVVSFNIR